MSSEIRVAAGHKANLSNPNTSQESKDHSKEILKDEFGQEIKNPSNVIAGLKSAITNPNVSEEAKRNVEERLGELQE